jgi:hypothetical protein
MDVALVVATMTEVLKLIQTESGYEEVPINENTCPLVDLKGFDSKVWPVSIGMIGEELDIEIPLDKNIYVSEDGTRRLTIKESASVVYEIAMSQEIET